ncbi:hypothetical protein K470DRAFT_214151 [Piedraia hortae CBS 480.64]|uniref:non-specific serine/threonine protein kinase n=1 Tax=Piedraia hortae CBS 480.64 TaxID=1314780 RepID=A0A6A7C4Y5_9PEZI|nr:hypothetical protein K470DRAFT_214151 [Piedraia hortae CBS 480.64]
MGQGYSTLPVGPNAVEAAELTDLTFERGLGGARFWKTVRARDAQGVVIAKVCMKVDPNVSFKKYAKALRQEREAIKGVSNVLPYQYMHETNSFGLLVRPYIQSSLYDRISIRPFLENIEKKWIAFQLLCAVRDCHSRGVFHGDIKTENVLVTSWSWVYLCDFSSAIKPAYLPEDNPADFSYYFDTTARRTCYLAPERFLAAGQKPVQDEVVQWNMDIFSLGCVLAELFTESPTFTLSQLFNYRKGEYDPTASLLSKINDQHVRDLIGSMLKLNPEERWHAQDYLDEYKDKAFPLYFYQHLHVLMQEITDPRAGQKRASNAGISDDRINRLYDDFEMISASLGYSASNAEATSDGQLFPLQIDLPNVRHTAEANQENSGTFILLNVVTSSLRSAGWATTKMHACELFLAFGERLTDEARLDRILPYAMLLLDDPHEMVLVSALRTMTHLLAMVRVVSPINSLLFTQYVFPRLQTFIRGTAFKNNPIVRATFAACLTSLAETAIRFLDLMQALGAEDALPSNDKDDTYTATHAEIMEFVSAQTRLCLTDDSVSVRRAFLPFIPRLCIFFSSSRVISEVILVHLNTYLNDSPWELRRAFFRTVVGVAVYMGVAILEEFFLPLMLQALSDKQEFVIEQVLRSLATMAELGLFQREKSYVLIDIVARFLLHPNGWIKEAAAHFISASTTFMTAPETRIIVLPRVRPYLKYPIADFHEVELLDALTQPLQRGVFELAVEWARRDQAQREGSAFWKRVKPSTQTVTELVPKSLAKLAKTEEDNAWLNRLRSAGMQSNDEGKILVLGEYIYRIARGQKGPPESHPDENYDRVIPLSKQPLRVMTVQWDQDNSQTTTTASIREALEEAVSSGKTVSKEPTIPVHNYQGNSSNVHELLTKLSVDTQPLETTTFSPRVHPYSPPTTAPFKLKGQIIANLSENLSPITCLTISPDQTFFLTGSRDGSIKTWDTARLERNLSHRARSSFTLSSPITSLTFIPQTHVFACSTQAGEISLYKVNYTAPASSHEQGKYRKATHLSSYTFSQGEYAVSLQNHHPDGLMGITNQSRIVDLNLRTMTVSLSLLNPVTYGIPTSFLPSRKRDFILVATNLGVLSLWDLRFNILLKSWVVTPQAAIGDLRTVPSRKSGRRNWTAVAAGGEVVVFDVERGEVKEGFVPGGGMGGHGGYEGPRGSPGSTLRRLEDQILEIPERGRGVAMCFAPGEGRLVTAGPGGWVRGWDVDGKNTWGVSMDGEQREGSRVEGRNGGRVVTTEEQQGKKVSGDWWGLGGEEISMVEMLERPFECLLLVVGGRVVVVE